MPSYVFKALFTASKVGVAPASAPTVDVCNGAGTLVVTGGVAVAMSGITGLYSYVYTGAADEYVAVFKTSTTTVDLQHIPSWTPTVIYTNLDATVSSRNATTPPTAIANASQVRTELATELARIDVATSTRLATAGYTAPTTPPTAVAIADQVWDEALSGHAVAGSTGAFLTASGAASDPLLNPVPGSYASGTAGAALGNIAGATVTVVSPVAADGTAITLTYGDDYASADNRALVFTALTGPVLTGGAVALRVQGRTGVVAVTGVVTGAHSCYVELTDTQVIGIGVGTWPYDLEATLVTTANVVTLVTGYATVTQDVR